MVSGRKEVRNKMIYAENETMRMLDEYRQKIIEAVEKINDIWVLNQIYRCIVNITKEE